MEYPINLYGKSAEIATDIFARKLSPECVFAEWYIERDSVVVTQLPWRNGREPKDLSLSELKTFSAQQRGFITTAIIETEQELAHA